MLKTVLTFLAMVATTCLVFAGLGILTWPMVLAVLVGSGVGSVLARARLTPPARRPVSGTTSRSG